MKHRNYLYEYDNRIIVSFFSIMALLNFIVIIYKKCDIDRFFTISGISVFSFIPVLIWVFKIKRPRIYQELNKSWDIKSEMQFVGVINDGLLESNNSAIIDRTKHISNITSLIKNKFKEKGFKATPHK